MSNKASFSSRRASGFVIRLSSISPHTCVPNSGDRLASHPAPFPPQVQQRDEEHGHQRRRDHATDHGDGDTLHDWLTLTCRPCLDHSLYWPVVKTHRLKLMNPAIARYREQLEGLCRRYHVRRLELFGSAASGRLDFPDHKILLTFFSPSGYEIRKNYEKADYIFYLPMDTSVNARKQHNPLPRATPQASAFSPKKPYVTYRAPASA